MLGVGRGGGRFLSAAVPGTGVLPGGGGGGPQSGWSRRHSSPAYTGPRAPLAPRGQRDAHLAFPAFGLGSGIPSPVSQPDLES